MVTGRRDVFPPIERRSVAVILRALPVGALVGAIAGLSWGQQGSFAPRDWLPYAILAALILATILFTGAAVRPGGIQLLGVGALVGLAAWAALSAFWSPVPDLARDEALLTLLYALALIVPIVTLRSASERIGALSLVVAGLGLLALATAVKLRFGSSPENAYFGGRLNFPVTYANGEAAFSLVGFWPAVVLASRRAAPRWRS